MEVRGWIHAALFLPPANAEWLGGWVSYRIGLDVVTKRKTSAPPGNWIRSVYPAVSLLTEMSS